MSSDRRSPGSDRHLAQRQKADSGGVHRVGGLGKLVIGTIVAGSWWRVSRRQREQSACQPGHVARGRRRRSPSRRRSTRTRRRPVDTPSADTASAQTKASTVTALGDSRKPVGRRPRRKNAVGQTGWRARLRMRPPPRQGSIATAGAQRARAAGPPSAARKPARPRAAAGRRRVATGGGDQAAEGGDGRGRTAAGQCGERPQGQRGPRLGALTRSSGTDRGHDIEGPASAGRRPGASFVVEDPVPESREPSFVARSSRRRPRFAAGVCGSRSRSPVPRPRGRCRAGRRPDAAAPTGRHWSSPI